MNPNDEDDHNVMDDLVAVFVFCIALFGIGLIGSLIFAFVLEVLA